MHVLSVIILLTALILPPVAFSEVQTLTATHTYILGDHDSKDDARQRCLLEAKRKLLEQAGVYIESASEVKNFDLTKDTITSFAAAVMQVKDTKEEVGFQQGHMTLTLKLTAQVDLIEVHKQLAARQLDEGMRDDVAAQKERLKRLEAQLEAMQQQMQHASGRAPDSPPIDTSLEELQTQAAQGNVEAQIRVGWLYAFGEGVPHDYAKARKWWERAAVQGDPVAQSALGELYADGLGGAQDYAKARKWWEKAAARGNARVQFNLGTLYYSGRGVPQDYTKARQWYEKAAAQGFGDAQIMLGLMYANGQGVPQDYTIARQWYEKAAAQGDAGAQYNLGRLYDNGEGVPQDYAKAAQCYEKAATQGHTEAQTSLGVLYVLGQGVPQDFKKARQWWEQAAAQGDADAQQNLGLLFVNGQGVPQDDVRAHMWWSLSAAHLTGDEQKHAVDNRDKVALRMTPAQVAEAKRMAQQCQAQQFKGC